MVMKMKQEIKKAILKKLKPKHKTDSNLWLHKDVLDLAIEETAKAIFKEIDKNLEHWTDDIPDLNEEYEKIKKRYLK